MPNFLLLSITLMVMVNCDVELSISSARLVQYRFVDRFGEETSLISMGTKVELSCQPDEPNGHRPIVRFAPQLNEIGRNSGWNWLPENDKGGVKINFTIASADHLGFYYCSQVGENLTVAEVNLTQSGIFVPYVTCGDDFNCNCTQADRICFHQHNRVEQFCGQNNFATTNSCEVHRGAVGSSAVCLLADKMASLRVLEEKKMEVDWTNWTSSKFTSAPNLCEYQQRGGFAYYQTETTCDAYEFGPFLYGRSANDPVANGVLTAFPLGTVVSVPIGSETFRLRMFCGPGVKNPADDHFFPPSFHWRLSDGAKLSDSKLSPCASPLDIPIDKLNRNGLTKLSVEYEKFRIFIFLSTHQAQLDDSKIQLTAECDRGQMTCSAPSVQPNLLADRVVWLRNNETISQTESIRMVEADEYYCEAHWRFKNCGWNVAELNRTYQHRRSWNFSSKCLSEQISLKVFPNRQDKTDQTEVNWIAWAQQNWFVLVGICSFVVFLSIIIWGLATCYCRAKRLHYTPV